MVQDGQLQGQSTLYAEEREGKLQCKRQRESVHLLKCCRWLSFWGISHVYPYLYGRFYFSPHFSGSFSYDLPPLTARQEIYIWWFCDYMQSQKKISIAIATRFINSGNDFWLFFFFAPAIIIMMIWHLLGSPNKHFCLRSGGQDVQARTFLQHSSASLQCTF